LVGAAVVVVDAVDHLGLIRTLVVGVGDAVVIAIGQRASFGGRIAGVATAPIDLRDLIVIRLGRRWRHIGDIDHHVRHPRLGADPHLEADQHDAGRALLDHRLIVVPDHAQVAQHRADREATVLEAVAHADLPGRHAVVAGGAAAGVDLYPR